MINMDTQRRTGETSKRFRENSNVYVNKSMFRRRLRIAMLTLCAVSLLSSCLGYVPGQQSYWDTRVKELCAKDGGVTILERVPVSRDQYDKMPKVGGYAGVRPRQLAKPEDVVVADRITTILRDGNPKVWRSEELVKRRTDGKIVARVVRYVRVGGDIPSHAHPSSLVCPKDVDIFPALEQLFMIEGASK